MDSNPILEEVWRIKEELAREAGYDVHRLCENTRQWMVAHPHPGPVVRNAEELRCLAAPADGLVLAEQPPGAPQTAATDVLKLVDHQPQPQRGGRE
jgi:hypothetical protein